MAKHTTLLLSPNRQKYIASPSKRLLYFLCLCLQISQYKNTNLKMLTPLITDLSIDSFTVDQDLVPPEFLSASRFSLVLEVLLTFDVPGDLSKTINLFEWGDQSSSHSIIKSNSLTGFFFKIDQDPTHHFFPTFTSKFHLSQNHFTLNLIFEFEVDSLVSAYILTFPKAGLTFPTAAKTLLSSASMATLNGHFFALDLTKTNGFFPTIKNMYVVDRFFAESDYEVQNMFKGLANLHQAVYLYMEPTYSKIFLNRSRYSYPGAYCGEKESSFSDLTSVYSTKESKINWMLSTFINEYMGMSLDALQSVEPASVSFVVNFDLYLRTEDVSYIDQGKSRDLFFVYILDSNGEQTVSVSLQVDSYNPSPSTLTYRLKIFDRDESLIGETIFIDEAVEVEVPLLLNMLTFTLFYKTANYTCLIIEINKKNEQLNTIKKIFCFMLPMNSFSNLFIGHEYENMNMHPPFIVVLFDVLVFQGGYFITNGSDSSVLHSFSKTETEVVYCKNNRNLSRYNPNAEMNKKHLSIKANASSCEDLVFDLNCSFSGCQICGLSTCLVCHENYELLDDGSCESFDTNLNAFDNFSRRFLSEVSEFTLLKNETLTNPGVLSFSTVEPVYIKVAYDTLTQTDKQNIEAQFNGTDIFVFANPNSVDSSLRNKLFESGTTSYRYVYQKNTNFLSNELRVLFGEMKFEVYEIKQKCTPSLPPMKGSYLSAFCDGLIDLRNHDFFAPFLLEFPMFSVKSYVFFDTLHYPSMYFPCMNNCDCLLNTPTGCSLCDSKTENVFYNYIPMVNDCVPCPEECATCKSGKCLTCDQSSHYSAGNVIKFDGVTASEYLECVPCNPSCLHGCSGPEIRDCLADPNASISVNCPGSCTHCIGSGICTECPSFLENLIYTYDSSKNEYITRSHYFCQTCADNCFACSSGNDCTCAQEISVLEIIFVEEFNSCLKTKCTRNCVSCESVLGCTLCVNGYVIKNGECQNSKMIRRNCVSYEENKCMECPDLYYQSEDSRCERCSSNCLSCEAPGQALSHPKCRRCKPEYLLLNAKCFLLDFSTRLQVIGFFSNLLDSLGIDKTRSVQDDTLSRNCAKRKNEYSSVCLECEPSYYLTQKRRCQKCPVNSLTCHLKNSRVMISSCKPRFYHSKPQNKCLPCRENCLSCDALGCVECVPQFVLLNKKCAACSDPNCEICLSNSTCARCVNGFFFSLDTRKCKRCLNNCKYCLSDKTCSKCEDNYELIGNQCIVSCEKGLFYRTPGTNECVPCSQCESCSVLHGSVCSSCDVCKAKCAIHFTKISSLEFQVWSEDVVFPSSGLQITTISQTDMQITSSGNSLSFSISPKDERAVRVQSVIHSKFLYTKQCTLYSDISLTFTVPASTSFFRSSTVNTIAKATKYTKKILNSAIAISNLSPSASIHFNSVIFLLNLNELFSYSFILATPFHGFSTYLYRIFRLDNFETSFLSPYRKKENIYFLVRSNEINIKAVSLFSYEMVMYLFIVALFIYFEFFYNQSKNKFKEFTTILCKRDHLSDKNQKLLSQIKKSLPTEHFNDIQVFLSQHESSAKKTKKTCFSRLTDKVHQVKDQLLFVVFQSFCIDIVHHSVKSLKMLVAIRTEVFTIIYCLYFHFVLMFFVFLIARNYTRYSKKMASSEANHRKEKYLLRFVFYYNNLPFLVFTVVYVYVLLLISNKVPHSTLVNVMVTLFCVYVYFQKQNFLSGKTHTSLKVLSNFPVLVVLTFSALFDVSRVTFLFDFLFIALNVLKSGLFGFEVLGKVKKKQVAFLKEKLGIA